MAGYFPTTGGGYFPATSTFDGGTVPNATTFSSAVTFSGGLTSDGGHITVGTGGWRVQGSSGSSAALLNETPSPVNPSLVADRSDLTTGVGGAVGTLDLITGGVSALHVDASQNVIFASQAQHSDGTNSLPSIAFKDAGGNWDTGFYRVAVDEIGVTNAGALTWRIGSSSLNSGLTNSAALVRSTMTATVPGFIQSGDFTTGIGGAAGTIDLITGGVSAIHIAANQTTEFASIADFNGTNRTNNGSEASPSRAFTSESGTGTWWAGAGIWALSTSTVERLRVSSTVATFAVDVESSIATGPALRNEAATGVNATVLPSKSEESGLGLNGTGNLSFITQGTERFRTDSTNVTFSNNVIPVSNNTYALGSASLGWSDLDLGGGAVIGWDTRNMTLTHTAGVLTVAGGQFVSPGNYAEIYYVDTAGTTSTQTTNATPDTFDLMTVWNTTEGSDGESNGSVAAKASNKITTGVAGKYRVTFAASFTCSNAAEVDFQVFLGGVAEPGLRTRRSISGGATNIGSVVIHGVVTSTGTEDMDIRIAADAASEVFEPYFMNFNILYLGT